ncbi:MAG: hypothetical protein L3J41_05550 [Melioribacteraceae bacterium]|nr:hypothetical protein [Melioribacteraceae bacterium]
MQLIIKIIALLSSIIGVMAVVTGSKVLLGMFYPDYQYYNISMSKC